MACNISQVRILLSSFLFQFQYVMPVKLFKKKYTSKRRVLDFFYFSLLTQGNPGSTLKDQIVPGGTMFDDIMVLSGTI